MTHHPSPTGTPGRVTGYSTFWPGALAHALNTAGRGLPVFPLGPAKLPAVRSPHPGATCRGECGRSGHGVHDATTDPGAIRELFRLAPHATGYGIACGQPPQHLLGLDLDRKNGLDGVAALGELARYHGFVIPDTVTVATPTGGVHLWLTSPTEVAVPNSASRIGPGIDLRGSGGYLVGPGSWTPKGTYREAPGHPTTPQPVPPPLLRLLAPPPEPTPRRPAVTAPRNQDTGSEALVRFVTESPEGQLNNRLFWAACRAWEAGPDAEQVAAALLAAACAAGHPERAAARTIASARTPRARRGTR